jgi:hypothetical protein
MKKTTEKEEKLTPEQVAQLLGVGDVDRMNALADIEAQQEANHNERERITMEKVRLCASLLECDRLDNIDFGLVRAKMLELVAKL